MEKQTATDGSVLVHMEGNTIVISARHPNSPLDYDIRVYGGELSFDETSKTKPIDEMSVSQHMLSLLCSIEKPEYPRCDCGSPADGAAGKCVRCEVGMGDSDTDL